MTQEFYISVTPVREDEYWIRTERVSPGVPLAEELVTWNVDEWLAQASQLMHDPLLGLLRGHFPGRSTSDEATDSSLSHSLVALGQTLYNALFQGTIRDSWMTAQGVAQNRREDLRLRLGLRGDRLPRLPWEVLNAGGRPLATGTDVVFSRYQSAFAPMATVLQSQPLPVLKQNQPLKILMVLAAPTDQDVLALRQEANHLNEELQREQATRSGTASPPAIELTILDQPGREQLTQTLEQGCYQVLHYAGHSNLGGSGGDLYLVSDKTGLTEVLSGDDLAGLLVNNGIRMAVFNSCRGVYTATSDPVSENGNLTEALLRRGVPAVLAMAERIPDDVALTLSRLFYRNLRQRSPIDLSLSRARQGLLSSYGSNQLYWALPILYLHPDFDGYLQPPLNPDSGQIYVEEPLIETPSSSIPISVIDPLDSEEIDQYEEPDDDDRDAVLDLIRQLSGEDSNPFGAIPGDESFSLDADDLGQPEPNSTKLDLHGADNYLILGDVLYAQGNVAGAIGAYGDAIQITQSAEAYSKLGIALEAYGDNVAQAIAAYQLALQLDPGYESARQNLQRLYKIHHLTGLESESEHSLGQAALVEQSSYSTVQQSSTIAQSPQVNASDLTATAPSDRVFKQIPKQKTFRAPWKWAIAGVSAASVVVLGIWGVSKFGAISNPSPDDLLRRIPSLDQPSNQTAVNPDKADTNNLTEIATTSFSQGNLKAGQEAVEALLDRNALSAAGAALQALPADKDIPATSFLRGRLVWQFVKTNNRNYSGEDARRYWETAIKGSPNPLYYNALGFAYYREGNLKRASDAWFQVIALLKQQKVSQGDTAKTPAQDALVAYSGLALVAMKSLNGQPADQQTRLKGEAVKLRDQVLRQSPTQFQTDALAKKLALD